MISVKTLFIKIKKRIDAFLSRRPHRSFRRTRRRDYKRPLGLPGYFKFSKYVRQTVWKNRKIFLVLALVYAIITVLAVGLASQDTYSTLTSTLNTTSGDALTGFWGTIGKAGLLFVSTATGSLNESLSSSQAICAGLILMLTWLTTVWLLRNILAGHKVKVRDGIYSSGAPILSTFIIVILILVQMLPFALALIGYGAASTTGLLTAGGVESMLFWFAAALLTVLSLYWMTSTVFALIIVTLPGMYPYRAIKAGGDLVVGRRLKLLLRLLWMVLGVALSWAIVMIPMILFDGWLKSIWTAIASVPIIPVTLLVLSSLTIIWASSYIYLLYRKVIADESSPA